MIYGVALLAGCMLVGSFIGNILGIITGLNSDIGGVGFAMILLLLSTNSPKITKFLPETYTKGINFWKEMYIPVTIAMSASQNVVGALNGGLLALVLGVAVVLIMLLLIPVFNKFTSKATASEEITEVEK
jgi:malonate transporter MadL subunit